MRILTFLCILLLPAAFNLILANGKLSVDPGPGGDFPPSQHFEVKINGISSFTYQNFKRDTEEKYLKKIKLESISWTTFACPEKVEVEITFLKLDQLNEVVIRPLSLNISGNIKGNKVKFKMPTGRKVTIEEKGNLKHVCFLFGHSEDPKPKGIASENIITFEAGTHFLPNDLLYLKSNQAVVLKPGAYIYGRIHGEDIENSQILGRGTLTASHVKRSNLKFGEGYAEKRLSRPLNVSGKNLRLQGPTIVDAPFWSTRIEGNDPNNLNHVSHMAVLGWYVNSDGFQDMKHTRASDLFTCVNDDSFILNNTGDCIVERSVVWGQLAGAPLRLGWNGTEDLDTTIYRDIDVLHFDGGAAIISLKHGGPSHVKNIFIEDIRIEEPVQRFLELEIKKHVWSPPNTDFGRVSNIQIKNIKARYPFINLEGRISHILGADENHQIQNITLENIEIAGKKISSLKEIPLRTNNFTENIQVK